MDKSRRVPGAQGGSCPGREIRESPGLRRVVFQAFDAKILNQSTVRVWTLQLRLGKAIASARSPSNSADHSATFSKIEKKFDIIENTSKFKRI